jgi:arylsulfatase A-like enzyme
VYDSVLHVPLFLRHPASLTGRRVMGELVELQDLLPTILDWFDLPVPAGVRGRSLLPLIDGDPFESRDAFATWRDRVFTVRTEDWRYVWNPDGIEPTDPPEGPYPIPGRALYDVRRDPLERHDVLEGRADVGEQLEARIRSWRATLVPVCESGREIPPWRRKDLQDLGYLDGAEAGQEQSGGGGAGDAGSTGDDR